MKRWMVNLVWRYWPVILAAGAGVMISIYYYYISGTLLERDVPDYESWSYPTLSQSGGKIHPARQGQQEARRPITYNSCVRDLDIHMSLCFFQLKTESNKEENMKMQINTRSKLIDIPGHELVLTPRTPKSSHRKTRLKEVPAAKATQINYDLGPLLDTFGEQWQWKFIKARISDNWPTFIQGAKYLLERNMMPSKSTKRKAVVLPGLIQASDYVQRASFGGPLGELVQWSDLIAGLHILGHDIELHYDHGRVNMGLKLQLSEIEKLQGCNNDEVDYIYTDLIGHNALSAQVTQAYRNKFRILDHFGTQQMYNNEKYARSNGLHKHCGVWGLRNLHLKQFYTGLPLEPDNSFIGFVVGNQTVSEMDVKKNKNIAYIYGKDPEYIEDTKELLLIVPILQKFFEVHTTLPHIPDSLRQFNLVNHGQLDREEYLELANKAKVVVGVGRPEEGPGVLEAISRGSVFINPKREPHWKYDGKPTNRTLTSQNPYAEKFIGPPYAYTVDYKDERQVQKVVKLAMEAQLPPFIPFELTAAGYIQRLYSFLEYQNFCDNDSPMWPPIEALIIQVGTRSKSCNEVCELQGLVCENIYFPAINNINTFQQNGITCDSVVEDNSVIYAPAYISSQSKCVLQKDMGLFSCASYLEAEEDITRICPCRDFVKHQVQLCNQC